MHGSTNPFGRLLPLDDTPAAPVIPHDSKRDQVERLLVELLVASVASHQQLTERLSFLETVVKIQRERVDKLEGVK